jgi:hypothetical protein
MDQRPKVTVEDLLHLKRAERPTAEFWNDFERELRQKQLAALLEKRPWWRELPQLLVRRAYLPVGATAILAFTLVSVKYYAPSQSESVMVPVAGSPAAADREVAVPTAPVSSPLFNRSETVAAMESGPLADSPVAAEPTAEVMPRLMGSLEIEKPSARLLADNYNGLAATEADFGKEVLSNRLSPLVRVATAASSEELASVPNPTSRRNRLLAQYDGRQLNPEPAPPAVVRERLARRLGNAESADRGSRFSRELDAFGTPMPQIVAFRF